METLSVDVQPAIPIIFYSLCCTRPVLYFVPPYEQRGGGQFPPPNWGGCSKDLDAAIYYARRDWGVDAQKV